MITGKNIEIPITGLTSNPSDYECPDGQMQVCHNIVGGKSIAQPAALMLDEDTKLPAIEEGGELVFVHNTSFGKVYICVDADNILNYYDGQTQWLPLPIKNGSTYVTFDRDNDSLTHVGNVLIVNFSSGVYKGINYLRWKNDNGQNYKYLGMRIPDINAIFALRNYSDKVVTNNTQPSGGDSGEYEYIDATSQGVHVFNDVFDIAYFPIKDEKIDDPDRIFAAVNRVINKSREKSLHIKPFFVRYAYEMYDGNYIMQSSPVLMVPDDVDKYKVYAKGIFELFLTATSSISVCFTPTMLQMKTTVDENVFNDWKDIIQGVSIFVTPDIANYSSTGELSIEGEAEESKSYTTNGLYEYNDTYYKKTSTITISKAGDVSGEGNVVYEINMPLRDGSLKDWCEQEASNFRLLKRFSLKEVCAMTSFTDIERGGNGMVNMNTFEQLSDGYRVRSAFYPKFMHTYNNRLNIANIYIDEIPTFPEGFLGGYVQGAKSGTAYVYIEEDGVWNKVSCAYNSWSNISTMAGFFYYPNPNAKYLQIGDKYIKLRQHPTLNGAYYLNEDIIKLDGTDRPGELPTTINGASVPKPNWVVTSEVDNPFIFPALGVNQIGSGKIKTIKSATKAMSEGTAFGAQPLYVFTEDGIYSLSVNATGLYDKAAPLSRETVSEASKVLSIDNSVIFLNERGLMELYGSRTRCLSEQLTEKYSCFTSVEDNIANWNKITGTANDEDMLNVIYGEASGFMDYIQNARLAFDYVNYRIYVYDADKMYAYVYDIGTKLWSTCGSYMISSVEGFPSTLINVAAKDDEGNDIVQVCHFSHDGDDLVDDGNVLWLTRPMKFQMHDILKTVRRVLQRGRFHNKSTLKLALWGSRDMEKWIYVGGVQNGIEIPRISGTPYKYFVVGGCAKMDKEDMFNRISIEEKEKYYNKQR